MLFVFLVDTGVMYTFDVELAMESVQTLMSTVASAAGIPEEKQVLLISGGETLDPTERVCNYSSAGTDTSPIYLFSKSTIESSVPPSPSLNLGSEASLREQAENSLDLPPTYETLVTRANLASEFDTLAAEISDSCESLVTEQQLQQHGWNAVVCNLESISREFQVRASTVQQTYNEFLEIRADYMGLLNSFEQVMPVLGKVPVFPTLLTRQPSLAARARQSAVSLLEWIDAQDSKNSLQDMVKQCMDAVNQFDENILQEITSEIAQVQESLNNSSMKEIRGLDERLAGLQQLLQMVQNLRQSQADMAQGFLQNKTRAQNLGDPSVLPDLCASHQKQLMMLLKNHSQLKDIRRRCARAKDELSANLHTRLRWIMYVEKKICDCDSTLILYHENIRRLKRRLDIIEQVNEAPKMYVLAAKEVVRRRNFSGQFLKWAGKVYESSTETQAAEMSRREQFAVQFARHFLQSLFTGLDDEPEAFWEKPPSTFDEQLPLITEHDLRELMELFPELSDATVSVSMKDESAGASRDSKTLEMPDKVPCFEMTGSLSKATAMSIDVSTQAQWTAEGPDQAGSSVAADGQGIGKEMAVEMASASEAGVGFGLSAGDAADRASGEAKEERDCDAQKTNTNSDTGSERSSGLEDNDLYKSAHEDYVTVAEADIKVDLDEQIVLERSDDTKSLSLGEISQTATLTSSVSQAVEHGTQTEESVDGSSPLGTPVTSLHDQLAKMELALEMSTSSRDRYCESHRLLKDLLSRELPGIREEHSRSKELVRTWLTETKGCMEASLGEWLKREEERARGLLVKFSDVEKDKEELQVTRRVVNELEGEKRKFEEMATGLELEKSSLLSDVKRLVGEKDEIEKQLKSETERLSEIVHDYRSKYEVLQSETQKLQEHKSLSEEGQQICFNSIITKMRKEKEQAVTHALEQAKKMELQTQQQAELARLAIEDKETLARMKELDESKFSQREQELVASLSEMEARLQEAENKVRRNEEEFQKQLEGERAKTLQLLDVERQMWQAQETTDGAHKTTELERGTEAIVEDEFMQRIHLLEKENNAFREKLTSRSAEEGSSLDQTKQALQAKDAQISSLQQQLCKAVQSPGGAAAAVTQQERISLKDFQSGCLILLVFDERYENYLVLSSGPTLHFLHPESLAVLDIATSGPKRRAWMLAQLTDKEYCQAKKAHNRFRVPVGTKFYRVQAKPYEQ